MGEIVGMTGDESIAHAVKLCDPDIIAAYPITPQTIMVERLADFVYDGELDSEFIPVESEHSAMSCCYGSSIAGARVFTASASQGIALMFEILFIVSNARLPVVMAVANRALSAPINIHAGLEDQLVCRDTGWISIFCHDCQSAYDTTIMAFKIAEDKEVSLPLMYGIDAFIISHALEGVETLEKREVEDFLPPRDPLYVLDPDDPISVGSLALQDSYYELKYAQEQVMINSMKTIKKVQEEFGELTGRYYNVINTYYAEDADVILVTQGAITGTARTVVDRYRSQGKKLGLAQVHVYRPFPEKELRDALKGAKVAATIDRSITFGAPGPILYSDVKVTTSNGGPIIQGFIAGLGGRDVRIEDIAKVADRAFETAETGEEPSKISWVGVRGVEF